MLYNEEGLESTKQMSDLNLVWEKEQKQDKLKLVAPPIQHCHMNNGFHKVELLRIRTKQKLMLLKACSIQHSNLQILDVM